MATDPVPQVSRIPLTEIQKAARTALLFQMADAIDALMRDGAVPYTKVIIPQNGGQ